MISARQLLNSVDALPYGERQRQLAVRARELAGTAELTALLDDLHGRGAFARRVALHLAHVAGDRAYVERCLTAEESDVVGVALGLAVRMGVAPEVLAGLVPELATAQRRTLYSQVRRRKAVAVAEALVPAVRARFGDVEAAVLLPVCDAGTVTALLPDLAYAVTGWRMLASRHPTVFLDWLDTQLAGPSSGWQDVLTATSGGLATVAPAEPERVLSVLSRVASRVSLPAGLNPAWTVLAKHDPARLLAFLVDPRRKDGRIPDRRGLWRAFLVTSDDDLARLVRTNVGSYPAFFRTVPPARRPAVYAAAFGERDGNHHLLLVIDLLPIPARAAEARRLLGVRAVDDDPVRRLEITARLTWAEAKDTLYAATRRSTAEERAHAYRCLVTAAAGSRDPEVFAELLRSLDRLTNEQDPVRAAAFDALARVPAWLFLPSEAPALLKLMTDAMTARDCSWQTQNSVRTLITNLVRHGAVTSQPDLVDAGIAAVSRLGAQRHRLDLSGLDRNLPRGGEHRVFDALRPRIAEDARHDSFEVALSLASGLGRRAWDMPELQEYVDRARSAADDHVVRTAVELWLAPPRTRAERLGEVFRADRSTITIPSVLNGIGFVRTDLVDEVLTKSPHGRFLKKGVTFVPQFHHCFTRWLPRQCAAYADLLAALAGKKKRQPWERAQAVAGLARVPGTVDRVREYLADKEVAVVEAALGGLAWTDEPAEALPDLMSYVDSDHARVAVYAATRCARFVPPARLRETLAPALRSRKVTSRKEAVRLLAQHHAPDVAGLLQSVWQRPDEHRDVRRAIVSAARWCLDDERTWSLLESAAAAEHDIATAVLGPHPHTIALPHRSRYAALVRAVADSPAKDTAQLGLAVMPKWAPWDDAETDMLVGRFTDLANTATWHTAMKALIAACDATENTAPLVTAATTLLATREPETTADRDLPVRQRLHTLTHWLTVYLTDSETVRAAAAELADLLAADRTHRETALGLAASAVTFLGDDDVAITRLVTLADEPLWAWRVRTAFGLAVRRVVMRVPQTDLLDVAEALAARSPAPAPQLLALTIAEAVSEIFGWSARWRELVTGLRTHDDADVRLAALDTFTSSEQ